MISQLKHAFEQFEKEPTISRILISGSGKFFCVGMDLAAAASAASKGGDASSTLLEGLTSLFEAIENSTKVTIAVINGPAFGGGIGLAFSCDLIICVKSATFTLFEVKLGLCPAVISEYVIREWGSSLAREAMLTARPVHAAELQAQGATSLLVDRPENATRCRKPFP